MLRIIAFSALLLTTPAIADSYLVFPSQTECQARDNEQATALGSNSTTPYWWGCVGPLSAGTIDGQTISAGSYALDIQDSGPYGLTTSNAVSGGTVGLSSTEQSELIPAADLAPLMPSEGSPE